MESIYRTMKYCLPLCHNQSSQSDEELESLPPIAVRQTAHEIRPPATPSDQINDLVNKRLLSLQQTRRIVEPEFQEHIDQQVKDAKNFGAIAGKLMEGVNQNHSVLEVFDKIFKNIKKHQLLRYESMALHNVYAMASHKAGDCESICKLYAFAAWGAGHKDVRLKQLEGEFIFKLDHDEMLPGRKKDEQFNFVLHTVLQVNKNNGDAAYFDPLFGRCVNISDYGVDLNKYLG